jgi:hypothetical protein
MGLWDSIKKGLGFAEGDQNAYPDSKTMMAGSEGWAKAKEREKVWKEQQEFTLRERHGAKTPDYDKNRAAIMDLYRQRAATAGPANVVAAKAGYVAPSGAGQGVQDSAASMLATAAGGGGPSAAALSAKQANDDVLRARMSQMSSTRGGSAELASAALGGAATNAMSSAAVQAAAQRSQEQMGAAGQLAGLSGAMRSADIGTASDANRVAISNAGLAQSVGLANQSSALQWQAMSDAEKRAALGMLIGLDQNEMTNRLNYYRFKHGMANRDQAQALRDNALRDAQMGQLAAGAGQALGYGVKYYGKKYEEEQEDFEARQDARTRR